MIHDMGKKEAVKNYIWTNMCHNSCIIKLLYFLLFCVILYWLGVTLQYISMQTIFKARFCLFLCRRLLTNEPKGLTYIIRITSF